MEQRSVAVDVVFDPVSPPTTFEETVGRLGKAIRVGLLGPGTRLPPERELARQLGISRSTLRQAIVTLVQSGHLVSLRGRSGGTFVSESPPLTEQDSDEDEILGAAAWAVLDGRVAIEAGAVLLACERSDDTDLARLEALTERMADSEDFEDYRRADIRFHISLAEAARSPHLVTEMTEVQGRMSELIALIAHPEKVLTHSNSQHKRLVKLVTKGDVSRATRLIREHIEGTEHILAGLLPRPPG